MRIRQCGRKPQHVKNGGHLVRSLALFHVLKISVRKSIARRNNRVFENGYAVRFPLAFDLGNVSPLRVSFIQNHEKENAAQERNSPAVMWLA